MKIIGQYKLLTSENLGTGSWGKSYKAVHQFKDQTIVMRVIPKDIFKSKCSTVQCMKHIKDTLKNQIKYLSRIAGQNIAFFSDILQTGHNFYILREYCEEGSLQDLMIKRGKFSEKQTVSILVEILKGIFQLIRKGIPHRNLVPQNILFKKGVLKISDFGIQKIMGELHSSIETNLRPEYKSLEVLQGSNGTFKADIWALGIILYEMLTGRHPWPATTGSQLKINIEKQKLKFPSDVEISMGMKRFIMSCLMVDLNERAEWSQIFQSNFLEQFNLPKLHSLNQKYVQILSLLKTNIIASNLDVQRYFQSQKITSRDTLNRKAFQCLVQPMAPSITEEQIEFLFVSLDKNANNQLEIGEFEQAMREFEIPLQGTYRRKAQKLLKAKDIDKQLQQEQRKQNQLTVIFQSIVQNMQKKQIYDLYQIFTQSDKKRLGALEFNQFVALLRKIDSTLTKTECQKIFKAFDKNNDNKISFKQFFANMCQVTGSPNGLHPC